MSPDLADPEPAERLNRTMAAAHHATCSACIAPWDLSAGRTLHAAHVPLLATGRDSLRRAERHGRLAILLGKRRIPQRSDETKQANEHPAAGLGHRSGRIEEHRTRPWRKRRAAGNRLPATDPEHDGHRCDLDRQHPRMPSEQRTGNRQSEAGRPHWCSSAVIFLGTALMTRAPTAGLGHRFGRLDKHRARPWRGRWASGTRPPATGSECESLSCHLDRRHPRRPPGNGAGSLQSVAGRPSLEAAAPQDPSGRVEDQGPTAASIALSATARSFRPPLRAFRAGIPRPRGAPSRYARPAARRPAGRPARTPRADGRSGKSSAAAATSTGAATAAECHW